MGTLDRERDIRQCFKLDCFCVEARLYGLSGHGAVDQDIWH